MVIFNSYVKLPEGNPSSDQDTLLAGTRPRASTTKVLPPRAVQARPVMGCFLSHGGSPLMFIHL